MNQRINNFINYSNPNIHNRYYSTTTSKNNFSNFIKKSNYNKNLDSLNQMNNQNNSNNNNHFNENRPYSFTSRTNNNYINKGLDYILGNANPNNIIDIKKRNGYEYKNYIRGKRNNYINKNIFFNKDNFKNKNNLNQIQNTPNMLKYFPNNNNNDKENKLLNNTNNNIIDHSLYNNDNKLTFYSPKQNFVYMNDILKLDNLDISIMNIGNNILNFISNKVNNESFFQFSNI